MEREYCMNGGCEYHVKNCQTCGWNTAEYERRLNLPLVKDASGIERKFVGINGKNPG